MFGQRTQLWWDLPLRNLLLGQRMRAYLLLFNHFIYRNGVVYTHFPEEDIKHLFEKFYRVDEARQTKTGGVGLGLAISKDIIEAHGGSIVAECKNKIFRIIATLYLK